MYNPVANHRRRMRWLLWLLPLLMLCGSAVLFIVPALPGVALQVMGFAPMGSVDSVWQETAPGNLSERVAVPDAGPDQRNSAITSDSQGADSDGQPYFDWFLTRSEPATVTVSDGARRISLTAPDLHATQALVGLGQDGQPLAVVVFGEDALPGICATLLQGCERPEFAVHAIEFRPGGAVLFGQVFVGSLSQPLGLVITVSPDSLEFAVRGVVLDGQLFALPAEGELAGFVADVVDRGNRALQALTLQAEGYVLPLNQILISETQMVLVFG